MDINYTSWFFTGIKRKKKGEWEVSKVPIQFVMNLIFGRIDKICPYWMSSRTFFLFKKESLESPIMKVHTNNNFVIKINNLVPLLMQIN